MTDALELGDEIGCMPWSGGEGQDDRQKCTRLAAVRLVDAIEEVVQVWVVVEKGGVEERRYCLAFRLKNRKGAANLRRLLRCK